MHRKVLAKLFMHSQQRWSFYNVVRKAFQKLVEINVARYSNWFSHLKSVIKAAGLFEDAGELHAARAQVVNVSLGVLVAVFKGALLLGLAP